MGRYFYIDDTELSGQAISAVVSAVSAASRASRPSARRVDDLLALSPTEAERRAIRRDFRIWFSSGEPSWNVMLGIYNVFRGLRLIQFDSPIPLFGETNAYRWLQRVGVSIDFFHGAEGHHTGTDMILHMNDVTFDPSKQVWLNLQLASAVLLHEAWHAAGGIGTGHNRDSACLDIGGTWGTRDSSFEYRGAWAAQYWYLRWLATHSGAYLSLEEKQAAAASAHAAQGMICVRPRLGVRVTGATF